LARELQAISDPYYCTACMYPTLSATVSVCRQMWLCIAARELRRLPACCILC